MINNCLKKFHLKNENFELLIQMNEGLYGTMPIFQFMVFKIVILYINGITSFSVSKKQIQLSILVNTMNS